MISPGHVNQRLLCLFGFTFAATSAFILCRSLGDAILLARLGPVALPPMLIISALVVSVVSFAWARYTRRLSLQVVAAVTQISSGVFTAVLLVLLHIWPRSAAVICSLYLLAEVRGCLSTILIAVLLNEGTRKNSDKRYFALVNAGAPLAGLSMGLLVGTVASHFQPSIFLAMCCCFDLLAWLMLYNLSGVENRAGDSNSDAAEQLQTHDEPAPADNAPHEAVAGFARAMLLLVACKVAVLAFVAYEWRIVANVFFAGNEQQLTAYFGYFYAASDGLIIAIQLLAAQRFLHRKTRALTLLGLPVYLAVAGACTLVVPGVTAVFVLLTAARGATVYRRGLHDIAIQILYGWLPERMRRDVVTRVTGIAKPAVEAGVACIVLVLSAHAPVSAFAWLWFPVVAVWLWAIARLLHYWKRLAAHASSADNESTRPDHV